MYLAFMSSEFGMMVELDNDVMMHRMSNNCKHHGFVNRNTTPLEICENPCINTAHLKNNESGITQLHKNRLNVPNLIFDNMCTEVYQKLIKDTAILFGCRFFHLRLTLILQDNSGAR